MPKTKVYEPEFKKKIIQLYLEQGRTIKSLNEEYQFIDGHKQEYGVRWLLRQMGICPNAYYNYKKNRKAGYREKKDKFKNKILQIYHEYSGNPGYRMMRVYLLRAKISLSNTTVLKYMQELGSPSTVTPKKPT